MHQKYTIDLCFIAIISNNSYSAVLNLHDKETKKLQNTSGLAECVLNKQYVMAVCTYCLRNTMISEITLLVLFLI